MSAATTTTASTADQSEATVVYVCGVFTPLFPAILKWAVKKDASPFVKAHITETLNWGITLLLLNIALSVVTMIIASIVPALGMVMSLVSLAIFAGHVYLTLFQGMPAMKQGKAYRYPFALRLVKD